MIGSIPNMFNFVLYLALVTASERVHSEGIKTLGSTSIQHSPAPPSAFKASNSEIPQLSVSDILALRRALQQKQFISRSGSSPPVRALLSRGYVYGTDPFRQSYPALEPFGDHMTSGSGPAPSLSKPSISTRFRNFMNSIFFRNSNHVVPAFHQPPSVPNYNVLPGAYLPPSGHLSQQVPFVPKHNSFSTSVKFNNKPLKDLTTAANSFSPSYAVPLGPSKRSGSPIPMSTAQTGNSVQPQKAAISSNPSFIPPVSLDKVPQYSSLYGTNGFTAKVPPVKSPLKNRTTLSTDERSTKAQENSFPSVKITENVPNPKNNKSSMKN